MKIIDLLVKISRGEEVPKKIKRNWEYEWQYDDTREEYCYMSKTCSRFDEDWLVESILNDTVEILEEEKKIPEKLTTWFSLEKDCENDNIQYANNNFKTMYEKINEICDYLKSKGDE